MDFDHLLVFGQVIKSVISMTIMELFFYFYSQIDKLIQAGANILAPIPIGPKRLIGTAVDYAHYMFQQVSKYS